MKLLDIQLSNFKRFTDGRNFTFYRPGEEQSNRTLILGNNGTGKSSLLQAIIMVTATATKERWKIEDFDYPGFDFRHLRTGRLPASIRCNYLFSEDERVATEEYAQRLNELNESGEGLLDVPSRDEEVWLKYDDVRARVLSATRTRYFQFSGYQYAKRLARHTANQTTLFDRVGNIYWYTEQRTSNSISNMVDGIAATLNDIRQFLASAYTYHIAVSENGREIQEGQFDFYASIEALYRSVFPNRKFIGSAPRFDVFEKGEAPDFFLSDGKSQYELSEMSAGERAIFPILMDFARWNINHSIIIIDEIELHLHPPLQQALVRALSTLGNDNQFIITSHSNAVAAMFDEDQIIRL